MNYKLPSLNIIATAVYFAWMNKAEFLRAIALPTLLLVSCSAVGNIFLKSIPGYLWLPYVLVYGLCFSYLAITCHRLILIEAGDRHRTYKAKLGYRELRFLGWVVAIYTIDTILRIPVSLLIQSAGGSMFVGANGKLTEWAKQIASIPALYVFARLSLAFPAAAIDKHSGLRWSWLRTRGNGWRIFVVVCLFPWIFGIVLEAIAREEATVLEQVVLAIFGFLGLAVEIIALSYVYKDIAKHYVGDSSQVDAETRTSSTVSSTEKFHSLEQSGSDNKLYVVAKVGLIIAIGYLLVGSLISYLVK